MKAKREKAGQSENGDKKRERLCTCLCMCVWGEGATYRAGQQSEVNGEMGGRLMEGNRDKLIIIDISIISMPFKMFNEG